MHVNSNFKIKFLWSIDDTEILV